MKAVLVRDSDGTNPKWNAKAAHAAREAGRDYKIARLIPQPAGTVIDHPDAYKLVRMGMAVPHDEECRTKCGLSPVQVAEAIAAQDRMQDGLGLDVDEDNEEDVPAADQPAE